VRRAAAAALLACAWLGGALPGCASRQDADPVEAAYGAQAQRSAQRLEQGARLAGYKTSFTSPAARAAFGADGPAYAPLLQEMRVPDGGPAPAAAYQGLMAEVELAFSLREPLAGPVDDRAALRRAVAGVHVALELPDRGPNPAPAVPELIAGGLGARYFALGPAVDPEAVDLAALECVLRVDGREVARGRPGTGPEGPWASLAWLAGELAGRGQRLEAGQVVLAGALGAPWLAPADAPSGSYTAECGSLGAVRLRVQ
jgi:2-keto-4-pentenoate hydratase